MFQTTNQMSLIDFQIDQIVVFPLTQDDLYGFTNIWSIWTNQYQFIILSTTCFGAISAFFALESPRIQRDPPYGGTPKHHVGAAGRMDF